MAKQKAVSKTKGEPTGPKLGKVQRSKERVESVRKRVRSAQALRAP